MENQTVTHWLAECPVCGAYFEWCLEEKPDKMICRCDGCFKYTGVDRFMKVRKITGVPDSYNGMIKKPCVYGGKYAGLLGQT